MAKQIALSFMGIASVLMLVIFFFEWSLGPIVFGVLVMAFPTAMIAAGASRKGKLGVVTIPALVLGVILVGGTIWMYLLRGQVETAGWFLGFPLSAAVQFYLVFLVPYFVMAIGYTLTFDSYGIREEDLADLRRKFKLEKKG
jgi:hypothetical protein